MFRVDMETARWQNSQNALRNNSRSRFTKPPSVSQFSLLTVIYSEISFPASELKTIFLSSYAKPSERELYLKELLRIFRETFPTTSSKHFCSFQLSLIN